MDFATITIELQESFALAYGALIFWALVFMVAATIIEAVFLLIDDWRRRQQQ